MFTSQKEKQILDRYNRTADNKIQIDIAAGKIEEIYNDFDKFAPYVKKELNQDLVEYIIDAVSEIGDEQFIINFNFATVTDVNLISRVQSSIQNYFLYLQELEFRELSAMVRTSIIQFSIGVVILSISVWINQHIKGYNNVVTQVFAQGLNVAAWVSLWHAISTFLINWAPHRKQIKMYQRISTASIRFDETRNYEQMDF